jgi:CBS domain-containing protein/DNA-binding winged helix-turn-helix (wHTH) protein
MSIPVWVSTDVPTCSPGESVQDALKRMSRWDCDSLPVCDASQRLVGSISMRDVCLHANANGKPLVDLQVKDVAERDSPVCSPEDPAPDLMLRMSETSQWSLPMVDRNGVLIGIVGFRDLLRSIQGDTDILRIVSAHEFDAVPTPAGNRQWTWRLLQQSHQLESPIGDRRHLTHAELRLLLTFIANAGKVLSRDSLMRSVCDRDRSSEDRYIDVLVGNLRRKFGECATNARAIVTVPNEGYLFGFKVTKTLRSTATMTPTTRRIRRPRASGPHRASTEKTGSVRPRPGPWLLEEINHLYESQGETEVQGFCAEHRIIASLCMTCSRLYRVVESHGGSGGLSHGWCSHRCTQLGTERAWAS